MSVRRKIRLSSLVGFGLAAAVALSQRWTLQEFCWSTWLAGLVFSWTAVIAASAGIVLTASSGRGEYEKIFPGLRGVSPVLSSLGVASAAVVAGGGALLLYAYLFGFYGLFLSVFAEMQPTSLFGRNGFINSDFFTPVSYLVHEYWPMALGTLGANAAGLATRSPTGNWRLLGLPFRSEILRMHLMTLGMPFLALGAWALFGERYQGVVILLLMGIFYLLPGKASAKENGVGAAEE